MKILFINQTFHPDRVATAQYLTDLACAASEAGHDVTVLASAHGYDDASLTFPLAERWRGIDIVRVPGTRLGKSARWRRATDFGVHLAVSALRLLSLPRFDVVVCLTSPPLVSTLGALLRMIRGGRFVFWAMDLNPDEAIAAGWLTRDSTIARMLEGLLQFSLRRADSVVALDRYMQEQLTRKGVASDRVHVIAPWAFEDVQYDEAGRQAFRRTHNLTDAFVVMYAGNHSPCNPLGAVIEVARRLRGLRDVKFCFVGGGSEFRRLQTVAAAAQASNLLCLPYQPREHLAAVLSAADLHLVTLGDAFKGLIHPSKIYNMLKVGAPVLYIGPTPSHVTDLLDACPGVPSWCARHDEVDKIVATVHQARWQSGKVKRRCVASSGADAASIGAWLHLLEHSTSLAPQVHPEHA